MQRNYIGKLGIKMLLISASPFVFTSQANASWSAHSKNFSNWEVGEKQECTEWFPSSKSIDWGKPLLQTRQCKIEELRDQIVYEKSTLSGKIRERERVPESRFSIRKERRQTHGTLDRLLEVVTGDDWTAWFDIKNSMRNCSSRLDVSSSSDLYKGVLDFQYCEQQVERRIPITEHWLSGKKVRRLSSESVEQKWVNKILTWSNVGKKDRWLNSRKEYGDWLSKGELSECYEIKSGLIAEKVKLGHSFVSWIECEDKQARNVKKVRYSLGGKREVVDEKMETRVLPLIYSKTLAGVKDYVVSVEKNAVIADWEPIALKKEDCSDDMLVSSNLEWGKSVTTYKTCSVKERFTTGTKEFMASGDVNFKDENYEFRESDVFIVNSDIGSYDYLIERTSNFRYGDWKDESGWDCGAWSPLPHNIGLSKVYTQYRNCKMSRSRSVEQLVKWGSGDKWGSLSKDYDFVEKYETKHESGTKLEKYELPKFSLKTSNEKGEQSVPLLVNSDTDFDRVTIKLSFEQDPEAFRGVEIQLIGPNGKMFDVPIIRSDVTLFFELEDYNEVSSGDWVMKVIDDRDGGETLKLDVLIGFQQTIEEKEKPLEI